MSGIEFDLTAIVAIWIGGAILIVPLLGATLRYGLLPLLTALEQSRVARRDSSTDASVLRRVAEVEQRLRELERGRAGESR